MKNTMNIKVFIAVAFATVFTAAAEAKVSDVTQTEREKKTRILTREVVKYISRFSHTNQ